MFFKFTVGSIFFEKFKERIQKDIYDDSLVYSKCRRRIGGLLGAGAPFTAKYYDIFTNEGRGEGLEVRSCLKFVICDIKLVDSQVYFAEKRSTYSVLEFF